MFPPRRKCRKLLVWIALAVVAQVMFSLFLHGEFNFAPVRRARTTKTNDRIKSRLRLQSQDEGNHKFIARSKLEHARGKDDSIDYERNVVINEIKSTDLPRTSGRNLQNIRRNQSINLSAGIIGPKGVKGKAIFNDQSVRKKIPKINFGHEFRTENRRGSNFTELEDVFISVKTTGEYHEPRVTILLDTWFQNARKVYFFTDHEDAKMNQSLGGHLIKTPCETGHQRTKLCCKMQAELDFFVQNMNTKWFCHFDDDNYVNVPALVKTLQNFNPHKDVYLGKPSLLKPMETWDRLDGNKKKKFWFATGGAGFCLSHALVTRMSPHISDGRFAKSCERIKLPDDCTIGFISESLLNVSLTRSGLFHSHLENLPGIQQKDFSKQISFSHGHMGGRYNRVNIAGPFDEKVDPSRFKSIHCLLYPKTSWCPRLREEDKIDDNKNRSSLPSR
ncbi:hypothetical protein ACROYT_G038493 [Oculina patagonica]